MTISIWRYSHLALAVSSFVFIILTSVTGIILAFQPISEQLEPYKKVNLNTVTLAETVLAFKKKYPEVIDIKVDANHFVQASVFTEDGEDLSGYFNPKTAEYLGETLKPSSFFQWVTNFHRSLFLKGIGRFFVGLCSFFLFLIAVSGTALIIKRQQGFKRFFSRIVNDNFSQYWHVVLGRLSLIPIIIITITGVYLSLEKFNVLPNEKIAHQINFDNLNETPKQDVSAFKIFQNTPLSQVKTLEFPFSEDVEDYFTLKLKTKEILVNQFTGNILSEENMPNTAVFSVLSTNLHTGKGSILWSVILAIATANILFFVYSGFAMTFKRLKTKLKNKFKPEDAEVVVLVGSENGSTTTYANAFYKQLLQQGKKAFITEMNNLSAYPQASQLAVITATYGQGDAPTNANRFLQKLSLEPLNAHLRFSVVGFGSLAYPDFCKFAYQTENHLKQKAKALLPISTINDKSVEDFAKWAKQWGKAANIPIEINENELAEKPKRLKSFEVITRTKTGGNPDSTFLLTLKPKTRQACTSGDLLAIHPKNDYRERLYSIGKVGNRVQLSVKLHENGMGSGFLNAAEIGKTLKARLVENTGFHLPKKASRIILIANGTGIAPFLGMISQNKKQELHLYLGLRTRQSFNLYKTQVEAFISGEKLKQFQLALSQDGKKQYVQHKLAENAPFIAETLQNKGVVMVCGSLAMQTDVFKQLDAICLRHNNKPLQFYVDNKQVKTDCY